MFFPAYRDRARRVSQSPLRYSLARISHSVYRSMCNVNRYVSLCGVDVRKVGGAFFFFSLFPLSSCRWCFRSVFTLPSVTGDYNIASQISNTTTLLRGMFMHSKRVTFEIKFSQSPIKVTVSILLTSIRSANVWTSWHLKRFEFGGKRCLSFKKSEFLLFMKNLFLHASCPWAIKIAIYDVFTMFFIFFLSNAKVKFNKW